MPLKLKDTATIATILLGFAVIPLAAQGHLQLAGLAVVLGAITDVFDGLIARATHTQNRFGAEFDLVADLVIYSFASSVIVFFALVSTSVWLAYALGVLPLLFGCLRLARFNVRRIEYPGYWIGLTRPGLAGLIVAYFNSTFFVVYRPLVVTAVFVVAVSVLNVSLVPYIGHHKRRLTPLQRTLTIGILAGIVVGAIFGYGWDAILAAAVLYLLSPLAIPRDERARLREFIREWKKEEVEEMS